MNRCIMDSKGGGLKTFVTVITSLFFIIAVPFELFAQTITNVSPLDLCVGETVTVSGSGLNGITKVVFKGITLLFSDGDFTKNSTTITFPALSGSATTIPTLVTTEIYLDPSGVTPDASQVNTMSIHALPSPAANPSGSSYCEGDAVGSVSVTDPGVGFEVNWYNVASGGTIQFTGITYTPAGPGSYFAEVVNTTTGCASANRVSATVTELQAPDDPSVSGSTYCVGFSVSPVTATDPGPGLRIDWYDAPTGGTYLASGLSYIPAGPGTFYAETFNTTTTCISLNRISGTVIENPLPPVPTGATGSTFCEGDPVTLVSVDAPPANMRIDWYDALTNGNFLASGTNYTPAGPGMYYAETVNTLTSCVSSPRVSATVTRNAAPALPTGPISSTYCAGDPVSQVSVNTPPAGVRIDWYDAETGGTLLGTGVSYTPASAGTYWAEAVNISTSCSSLSRVSASVVQNPLPADVANPINAAYCAGDPIPSIEVDNPGDGFTVNWYENSTGSTLASGTPSGVNNEIFTPATDATATYYAEVVNDVTGCISPSRVGVMITRNSSLPVPSNPVNAQYCTGESIPSVQVDDPGTGITVKWYTTAGGATLAAGLTSGNHGEIFTPTNDATATYYAELESDATGCLSSGRAAATMTRNTLPPVASNAIPAAYCTGDPIPSVAVNDPGAGLTVVWYANSTGTTLATGSTTGNNGEIFTPTADATGTYYAEIENDLTGCRSASRLSVTLTKNPLPADAANPVSTAYCAGDPVPSIEVDDPGAGFTVVWYLSSTGTTLAAGTPSGNNGEIFTPTADATATYYAEVENDVTGCISANRVALTVTKSNALPNAANPVGAAYCAGDPIPSIHVDDPGTVITVKWYTTSDGPTQATGTVTGNNGEIFTPTNDITATYYAELESDATGCVSASRVGITVTKNPLPANATSPVGAAYCAGDPIPSVSVADPGTGFTVRWYTAPTSGTLAVGATSGNNEEIFTPASGITATYYAELEIDATGCSSSSRIGATVTRNSVPANAANPIGTAYCDGSAVPSIRVNDPGNGLTVFWYTTAIGMVPAAGTQGGNNGEIFTPAADATATYFAEVKNDNTGCTSVTRTGVSVTKNALPANASNPINSEYCSGESISAVRVNDPGDGFIVRWYSTSVGSIIAQGTSSGNNGEIFTPFNDVSATYYAEVENQTTGCKSAGRTGVSVIKLSAPFQATNPVGGEYCADEPISSVRVNDPGNGLTIIWYENSSGITTASGTTSGNNEEIFTPANNISATYYAEVEDDATGCGSLIRVAVPLVKHVLPANASNPVDNSYCPDKALPTISVENPGTGLTVSWYTTSTGAILADGTTGGLNGEQFTPVNPGTATYYAEIENDVTGCISAGRTGVDVVEDPLSCSDTDILSFNFNDQKGSTSRDALNHEISLDVRYGTSLTSLVASFTLSAGATAEVGGVVQQSGFTPNDFSNDVIYSITAADGVTMQDWVISVGIAPNDSTDFLSYSMSEQTGPADINKIDHTIDLNVVFGTDRSDLVAFFTLSTGAKTEVDGITQESGVSSLDFTNPVTYTVYAQNGSEKQDWVVTVKEAANTATDVLTYGFPENFEESVIDSADHTVQAIVVYGTDVSDLVATFTLSPGASARVNGALQQSGVTSNDFSETVLYTVTAADGITTQDWEISVEEAPNTETEILSFSFPEQTNEVSPEGNVYAIEVAPGTDISSLVAYFILSDGATAEVDGIEQESGITVNDFTDTLTYTITAEDGMTTEDWFVTVTVQDIIDNENPVIREDNLQIEYPVGSDSIKASVIVTDNIGIRRVVFRYKKYQEMVWNEKIIQPDSSLFATYIKESLVGSHGMTYYFKAYDLKNNTDSTDIINMVLLFNDQNSPEIPELSFGSSVTNYQILSIPMTLDNNQVENVFDELAPYNIKKWRLFHFNNGITSEYADNFTTLSAGKGYWLIIRNETPIQVGAGTTTRIEDENGFAITLQPGWNQVGNPYNFDVSWDQVIDFNGNQNVKRIKLYNNGELSELENVPAFRGGFVFLTGDQSAFITIPPVAGFQNERIALSTGIDKRKPIDGPAWFLPIDIINGKFKNTLGGIGMYPESITGFDQYDEPLLPVPQEISGVEMFFPHEGEQYDKISKDIVASEDYHTWDFNINKYGASGNISLKWNNEYFGNNDFNLILEDVSNGQMIDMRTAGSYTYYASGIHKFRIYYGQKDRLLIETMPSSVRIGDIYPNPFNEEIFIPVLLPDLNEKYQIDVNLSDLKGNIVRQLSNLEMRAGHHQIRFGLEEKIAPSKGFYIVRIVITSTENKDIIYRKILKF